MLRLQHAHRHENLRTPSTLTALDAAVRLDLLTPQQGGHLRRAWLKANSLQAALGLRKLRLVGQLPISRSDLVALASWAQAAPGDPKQFEEEYLRLARKARLVTEHVFYGRGEDKPCVSPRPTHC